MNIYLLVNFNAAVKKDSLSLSETVSCVVLIFTIVDVQFQNQRQLRLWSLDHQFMYLETNNTNLGLILGSRCWGHLSTMRSVVNYWQMTSAVHLVICTAQLHHWRLHRIGKNRLIGSTWRVARLNGCGISWWQFLWASFFSIASMPVAVVYIFLGQCLIAVLQISTRIVWPVLHLSNHTINIILHHLLIVILYPGRMVYFWRHIRGPYILLSFVIFLGTVR